MDTDESYCVMSISASLSTKIMCQMVNDSCYESAKDQFVLQRRSCLLGLVKPRFCIHLLSLRYTVQYYDFILQPDHFYFIYSKFRPLETATEKNFKKIKRYMGRSSPSAVLHCYGDVQLTWTQHTYLNCIYGCSVSSQPCNVE